MLNKKDSNGGAYNLEDGEVERVEQNQVLADRAGLATVSFPLEPLAVTLLVLE